MNEKEKLSCEDVTCKFAGTMYCITESCSQCLIYGCRCCFHFEECVREETLPLTKRKTSMTETEAIEVLNNKNSCLGTTNCDDEAYKKLNPARDMAIAALEKQIPKKPIEWDCIHPDWSHCSDCQKVNNCFLGRKCPTCHNSLEMECLSDYNYCLECGQRLDWRYRSEDID